MSIPLQHDLGDHQPKGKDAVAELDTPSPFSSVSSLSCHPRLGCSGTHWLVRRALQKYCCKKSGGAITRLVDSAPVPSPTAGHAGASAPPSMARARCVTRDGTCSILFQHHPPLAVVRRVNLSSDEAKRGRNLGGQIFVLYRPATRHRVVLTDPP